MVLGGAALAIVASLSTGVTEGSLTQWLAGLVLASVCVGYAASFSLRAGFHASDDTLTVVRPFGRARSTDLRAASAMTVGLTETRIVSDDRGTLLTFGGAPWAKDDLHHFCEATGLRLEETKTRPQQ